MPTVYVDASISTKARAFGKVSGFVEVSIIPQVGDSLSFQPRGPDSTFAVVDLLRVAHRIIVANSENPVSLALDDIIADTDDDARRIIRFLEAGHGLSGDTWDE